MLYYESDTDVDMPDLYEENSENSDNIENIDEMPDLEPVVPLGPAIPVGPVIPVGPIEPVEPIEPVVPLGPIEPVEPLDQLLLLNEKKKEFEGSNNFKNNWIQCELCDVYHPKTMHLIDVTYCGHCWGWVNSPQLDLVQGIYNGPNTIDEIKNFLKYTYPLHPSTCVNQECIYNKIKHFVETKTLHYDFYVGLGLGLGLGFVVEKKKNNLIINNADNSNTVYNIKKKKKNIKINYKSSSIII